MYPFHTTFARFDRKENTLPGIGPGDQVYGVLTLYLEDAAYPNDQEQVLLDMMASDISLAMESQSLHTREMFMLNRLQNARRLSDVHDEVAGVLATTVEALQIAGGVLFFAEERSSELLLQAEAGRSLGDSLDLVKGLAGGAGQAETPLIIGDLDQDGGNEMRSLLIAPLRVGDRSLGSLALWDDGPDAFNRHRAQLVATVAGQAALLIENHRLYMHGEHRAVLDERARLAREIHDGLAQTLGYLKLRAAQIDDWLEHGDDQQARIALSELRQLLGNAYVNTREAIDGLRLAAEAQNLQAWVQEIVSEFEALSGIPVTVTTPPDVSLPLEAHVQLHRVVYEAFSNIRKHADATRAWLEWRQDDYWLTLHIKDNGCGFDLDDVPPTAQHGLRIMRERAELLDADFQVTSQEDKGTEIIVRLPLKEHVGEVQNE
jgi:two-component system nitrate/nitrite sensor histidine kinase NarX